MLVPNQRIVFFGYLLDSILFMVFLTKEKLRKLSQRLEILLTVIQEEILYLPQGLSLILFKEF